MEEKKVKRKLTAILSADVKGYSHLMQDDEEATVRTITAYREVMTNLIQGHDGRVVDAIKWHHLWSERYDRNTKDFFAVQDNISRNIVIALQVKLTEGEQARIVHDTENLEAWGYVTKAYVFMQLYTKEKNAKTRELYKQAVELDPNYAIAWIGIAIKK